MILCDEKLSVFLFNKTRRGLMALFFGHPDEAFYVNQLLQSLNAGSGAVQRELKIMTEAGIITRERRGNMVYYQANIKNPIFNELKNIVSKTFGVADILRSALEPVAEKIKLAFIFGSVANKTETRASDIDVMIVGDIAFGEVISCLSPSQKTLNREINPVVYPVNEFITRIVEEHYFIQNVLSDPKIFIIGDEDVLDRLVKSRSTRKA